MEQFPDKLRNMTISENRITYDETCNNGLIVNDKYIPEELLSTILCYIDHKTLVSCQIVCKRWNFLIKSYVWRKKAEITLGHALPVDESTMWAKYYFICDKKPFYKNLIINNITTLFPNNWTILNFGGNGWAVECPPIGVPPLPEDPIFNGENACFVTSYNKCLKVQVINLIEQGFSKYLLDNLQPIIKVSEYYSCRWDCPAVYNCTVQLLKEKLDSEELFASYNYKKLLEHGDQNKWFKFEHEFRDYGKGLRSIKFIHGGQDTRYWSGHYGSKMAGASVILELPEFPKSID
ncbi:PREDICTED: F-box only protein 2-like [Ceratosolen solmsi marchali]|uniref:F-box only protein 2-like n=1 Tax=Ceratosolen solmsi marchali TaxID=326594 RepID=A0AAJ6YPE4_9HYME|nr:PREDICTED: F-box only protein 2-like [Ceratosolen solmsi marchali]